jgi:hypothetical protein
MPWPPADCGKTSVARGVVDCTTAAAEKCAALHNKRQQQRHGTTANRHSGKRAAVLAATFRGLYCPVRSRRSSVQIRLFVPARATPDMGYLPSPRRTLPTYIDPLGLDEHVHSLWRGLNSCSTSTLRKLRRISRPHAGWDAIPRWPRCAAEVYTDEHYPANE